MDDESKQNETPDSAPGEAPVSEPVESAAPASAPKERPERKTLAEALQSAKLTPVSSEADREAMSREESEGGIAAAPASEAAPAEAPKEGGRREGQPREGQQQGPRRDRGPRPDRPPRPEGAPQGQGNREGNRERRGDRPGGDRPGGDRPAGDRGPRPGGDRGHDRGPRTGGGPRFDGPPMDIELEKLISDSLYLDNQAHAVVARMRDMDSGTRSQLRRLYGAVRRAVRTPEGERQHQFVMLRARLAYTIARHSLRSLDALERLLLQVTRKNDARGYERFKDLFEAIVAYNE